MAALLLFCALAFHAWTTSLPMNAASSPSSSLLRTATTSQDSTTCAILLFGLPRGFSVVWPSLQKHVIWPNAAYGCDYYVHAFDVTHEERGRSGEGGAIDTAHALHALQDYFTNQLPLDPLTAHLTRHAQFHATTCTDADFRAAHQDLLHRVETVMDEQGRPVYVPWKHENYERSTTTNILKMWHSIQSAWTLMEDTVQQNQNSRRKGSDLPYTRVAVLRLDVVYMTPVDIYQLNATHRDTANTHFVLPGFAQYPVNDRGIYGPTSVVRAWATERFAHVDEYVQEFRFKRPGSGIHSERYLAQYILPRRIEYKFPQYRRVERSDWCFYRVRADHSVWISDCGLPAQARRDTAVAFVTGCTCTDVEKKIRDVKQITCCVANQTSKI